MTDFGPQPGLAVEMVPRTSLDGTPGGMPLYKDSHLVGGIGLLVMAPLIPLLTFASENLSGLLSRVMTRMKTSPYPDK